MVNKRYKVFDKQQFYLAHIPFQKRLLQTNVPVTQVFLNNSEIALAAFVGS
jgi:hypothetical protein